MAPITPTAPATRGAAAPTPTFLTILLMIPVGAAAWVWMLLHASLALTLGLCAAALWMLTLPFHRELRALARRVRHPRTHAQWRAITTAGHTNRPLDHLLTTDLPTPRLALDDEQVEQEFLRIISTK